MSVATSLPRALSRLRALAVSREPFDAMTIERRDPELVAHVMSLLEELNRRWFKLEVSGLEHLAPGSPALVVGNHNGGVMGPDLSCTMATLWRALGPEAPLHMMAHDFAMRRVVPVGRVLQGLGAMRAAPENAQRVLERGGHVLVYPGGDLDAFRHFRDRHRIVFGPRAGFARVAQRAGVPIVPIVAEGAHRSSIIFHEGEWLARALGLTRWSRIQRFPLAFGLPWGIGAGPLPYLPLPFPIQLRILPPIAAPSDRDPTAIRDEVVARMQAAMDDMVADKKRRAT